MIEVEVKIPIDEEDEKRIIEKLDSYGTFLGVYNEEDVFLESIYDTSYGKDKTLKLRKRDGEIKLIFKQKEAGKEFKEHLEVEIKINEHDINNVLQLLKYLGFKEVTVIKKRRTVYKINDCTINLDHVENLGLFIEIEVLSDGKERREVHEKIEKVLSLLGISGKELIRHSYVEMLKADKELKH